MNKRLNSLSPYIMYKCVHCNRKYPDTVINIEGIIHHNGRSECLDKKECKKYAKKFRRKNVKRT